MKKLTGILALTACLLLSAVSAEAATGTRYYPRALQFKLVQQGVEVDITNGDTVIIEANQTLTFAVYAGDTDEDGDVTWGDYGSYPVSYDLPGKGRSVGLGDYPSNPDTYFNPADFPVYPTDKLGNIVLTANNPIDEVITFQLAYDDGDAGDIFYSHIFRVHFVSSYTDYTGYLFAPKSVSLRQTDGKKVSGLIEMKGGTTRTFEMWADDVNGDGVVDQYDYDVFAITNYRMIPSVITEVTEGDGDLRGSASTPSLLGNTVEMQRYPTRISTVTVSATNAGGDEGSDYNPGYGNFYVELTLGGTTANGLSVGSLLGEDGTMTTQTVSVRISAVDDGDDGGGGTCDATGAGTLLLLALPLLFRGRRGRAV